MKDKYRDDIADRFLREARTFINELIEGTNNYQQLYSLSEQFPHDYHDRFLVELIQNANDASIGGEVRIVLDETNNEEPPVLYVANQGKAFTSKNFEALCSLGLSDKDPMEAIGNKGLGFRSVLQVCLEPHIYSAADGDIDEGFNGYCFKLTPSARAVVTELVGETQTLGIDSNVTSEVINRYFRVDLHLLSESSRIEKLRARIEDGDCVVSNEVQYLSPYSFPIPLLGHYQNIEIFREEGFVTVIELGLANPSALEAVKRAIRNVVSEYLLFTPKLTKLAVVHKHPSDEEDLSVVFEKKDVEKNNRFYPPSPITGIQITQTRNDTIVDDSPTSVDDDESKQPVNVENRVWWVHSGDITGDELRLALEELPEKWHEVTRTVVTIAFERTLLKPQPGLYSIYLPTEQKTGSAVSINGSFYGNLARTDINFGMVYNELLLKKAIRLLIEMVKYIGETGSLDHGTAMIDILDCKDPSSSILIKLLDEELEESGTPLLDLKVIYPEFGRTENPSKLEFVPLSSVRVLPESNQQRQFFIPSKLSSVGACFPAEVIITNRYEELERLADRAGATLTPQDEEIADWIEKLGKSLLKSNVGLNIWNQYYSEVSGLNEDLYFQDSLRTCRFLLTEDRRLVAADGDGPRIFAYPVRIGATAGEDDEEDEELGDEISRVIAPSRIKSRVAFFHSGISLIEDGPSRNFNPVGRFLRLGSPPLVRDYETRIIVNEVIIPLVTKASSGKKPSVAILAQALSWAYQLYLSVTTDTSFTRVNWNRLRIPTVSGWKLASETYFSTSWPGTRGHMIEKAFPIGHPALEKLLVSTDEFKKMLRIRSSNFREDDIAGWIIFLRDQCRVRETPIVRQTSFLPRRPDEEQKHLVMSGQESTYNTHELGNFYNYPDPLWSEYKEYLRNNLEPPIRSWVRYYLEKLNTLEGFSELGLETSSIYAQLVSHGFARINDTLSTSVTRRGIGVTVSSARVDSSLAFMLKRLPWLPCVEEDESEIKVLTDPDHVWYVPPDVLDSPQGRMRYSFIKHLPMEVASSMSSEFRRLIGLRSIKITSAEEGLFLLGDLALSWKTELAPERHQYFIDLWRETMVETARMWEELTEKEKESARDNSRRRGFNGLLVVPAARRFPEWRDLVSEEESPSIVYIPDQLQLQSSMGEWIDIVEMRGEPIGSQVNMLKYLFESRIARISELEFIPNSELLTGIEEQVESAEYLTSRFQWLEAFTLTIYGLGRSLEMNVTGDPFRRVARDFKRLKYLEVPGLRLRIKNLGNNKLALSPPSHYWDKNRILLLNPEMTYSCEDLVAGLCGFFGVQDIEHPLRLALTKLGWTLDDTEAPDIESQIKALEYLHVTSEQFERIRRIVVSGDDEWVFIRLIPTLCALNGVDTVDQANEIKKRFRELSTNIGNKKALHEMGTAKLGFNNSTELHELAAEATSDEDTAYKLWSSHHLSLDTWNKAIRALGFPYRICRNHEIEEDYRVVMQEIKPAMVAFIREAIKESGEKEKYVSLKAEYDQIQPSTQWEEIFWELPFKVVIESFIDWLKHRVSQIPSKLIPPPSIPIENMEQLKTIVKDMNLDINHNDDLLEQQNRQEFERLVELCLLRLLGFWIASDNEKSQVPTALNKARDIIDFMATDTIKSVCQFEILGEANLMRLVCQHLDECSVFEKLGIENRSWSSYSSFVKDLPVNKKHEKMAKERLDKIREYNERRARTRSVLGEEYELPRGDSFEGLRDVIDKQLDEDLMKQVNLFQDPSLEEAPRPSKSGKRGTGFGGGGNISSRDRDLIGSVGEYLIFKVLCHQIGISEASQAWKSRNRRHFLAEDTGDDSLGYDFEFVKDGKKWQIEVKSSSITPRFFDLTENELEVARTAAKRRSRSNYIVYLVENALSHPEVHSLGNPFINATKTRFGIVEGGARVYFKLSRDPGE